MRQPKLDESNLPFAGIRELNRALESRQISSVELTRFFGKRLEKFGPRYNALALSLVKEAHGDAKDADSDLKIQRFRGPLQGIPYGAKDLISAGGHRTA